MSATSTVQLFAEIDEQGTAMSETGRCAEHREPGMVDCSGNDCISCQICGAGEWRGDCEWFGHEFDGEGCCTCCAAVVPLVSL